MHQRWEINPTKIQRPFTLLKFLGVQWCGACRNITSFLLNLTYLLCCSTYFSNRLGWQVLENTCWSWSLGQWDELGWRLEEICVMGSRSAQAWWSHSYSFFPVLPQAWLPGLSMCSYWYSVWHHFYSLLQQAPFQNPPPSPVGLLSPLVGDWWSSGDGGREAMKTTADGLLQRWWVRWGDWICKREGRGEVCSQPTCFSGGCGRQVPRELQVLLLRWKINCCI